MPLFTAISGRHVSSLRPLILIVFLVTTLIHPATGSVQFEIANGETICFGTYALVKSVITSNFDLIDDEGSPESFSAQISDPAGKVVWSSDYGESPRLTSSENVTVSPAMRNPLRVYRRVRRQFPLGRRRPLRAVLRQQGHHRRRRRRRLPCRFRPTDGSHRAGPGGCGRREELHDQPAHLQHVSAARSAGRYLRPPDVHAGAGEHP